MAMTETPPEAEEKSTLKAPVKVKRRRLGGLFFGGLALLVVGSLVGLGFWAAQSATDDPQATPSTLTPTPAITTAGSGVPTLNAGDLQQVYEMLADPAEYQTLFVATSTGIKRSTDSGQTWTDLDAAEIKGQ